PNEPRTGVDGSNFLDWLEGRPTGHQCREIFTKQRVISVDDLVTPRTSDFVHRFICCINQDPAALLKLAQPLFLCGGREAELLHQRRKERFARRACWVVKKEPRCRRRLRNELHAARLVAVPEIEVLASLSFRQFHQTFLVWAALQSVR